MQRIGLVLGAGGVVGQAYHAGVLAALENDLRWDPRDSEVIVGTSAGSITASLLRSGVPAAELAAWTVRAPLSIEGQLLEDLFGNETPRFEPFRPRDLIRRPPSLPGRHMIQHALMRPWSFRPMTAALALLAPGRADVTEHLRPLRQVEGEGWPERPLGLRGTSPRRSTRGVRTPRISTGFAEPSGGGVVRRTRLLRSRADRRPRLRRRRSALTHQRGHPVEPVAGPGHRRLAHVRPQWSSHRPLWHYPLARGTPSRQGESRHSALGARPWSSSNPAQRSNS